jgi:DNA-binding Lrp family transcriptional regulator
MEKAIVLVNLAPGTEEQTMSSLKGMEGVVAVYQLYGLYDLLLMVAGPDEQSIKSTISGRLRSNQNITSTITMKVIG